MRSFAYPFGMKPDHSAATGRLLAEAGYTSAFVSMHGPIAQHADPIALPRIKIEGGEGAWRFPLLCQGAMDGGRVVDESLWILQRPGMR